MISPILETPSPYMMSNSTCLNGGASLFLTTLTRVWLPTTSSRSLLTPIRRVGHLDHADRADVEAHRGVEFQRIAAGRGLGRAVHHADLHADLVDEDHHGIGAVDRGGELAQGLAHQPRLQPGLAVAHLAFEF